MSIPTLYGIKNCDTMKKAFNWLEHQQIEYSFHDYKKSGISEVTLNYWLSHSPWEELVNRRGMTWRKLSDIDRNDINNEKAIKLMLENTSLIKRPVLEFSNKVYLGFNEEKYAQLFEHLLP